MLKEIRGRLGFLLNVGLHYLTLDRSAPTLSGGEAQRIRLAGQIGCGLVGVLYILDEPSIGLHPRDNERLLRSLERLRDMGNTVLVVEHDEDTMRAADYLVDFGPGPGVRGGEVVAAGTFADVLANADSLTGQYLSGTKQIAIPAAAPPAQRPAAHHRRRPPPQPQEHHRRDPARPVRLRHRRQRLGQEFARQRHPPRRTARVHWPAGATAKTRTRRMTRPTLTRSAPHDRITGVEQIDKVIDIDQSPIGRTPRSNPATYIKVFDEIRVLFAEMPEAKVRGYQPGRFSFNKPGGRCEACEGNGSNRLKMDFLADVWVTCPVCEGRRFNRETLQVRFKGKSIHDVLEMDVQEALEHFEQRAEDPRHAADAARRRPRLHQARPALADALRRRGPAHQAGPRTVPPQHRQDALHPRRADHRPALRGHPQAAGSAARLRRGRQHGLVIEHNLDVIKTADWLIDLGPEGGSGGGEVVCAGTPEDSRRVRAIIHRPGAAARPPERPTKQGAAEDKRSKPEGRPARHRSDEIRSSDGRGSAASTTSRTSTSRLPREKMTVCCGPSGSGKSSLALDTIYAEGQRRYIESLSAYARQFLGQMQKPKVEHVSGLSPAISIEQKTTSKSPRSTVGTVTEVYDYLRILFARLGQPYCPTCQIPIGTQTADEIIDKILALPEGTQALPDGPAGAQGQEKYETLWDELRRPASSALRVDGKSYSLDEPPAIDHRRKHAIEVVVDRVIVRANQRGAHRRRGRDGARPGPGRAARRLRRRQRDRSRTGGSIATASTSPATTAAASFEPLNPHHFSFNSPLGWCPACEGLGVQQGASPALLIRDPRLSLRAGRAGRLAATSNANAAFLRFAEALARARGLLARHALRATRTQRSSASSCTAPAMPGFALDKAPTGRAAFAFSTRACFRPSTRRPVSAWSIGKARSSGERSALRRLRRLAPARRRRGRAVRLRRGSARADARRIVRSAARARRWRSSRS